MNAEIITVGTELLLGDILNENSRFLSQELAVYGIQLHYQSTVGDNVARLGELLSLAMGRSDLIVLTGGLGPTPDDVTRETVADALSLPLELHEESWRRIQEYFQSTGREMTENNKKQAMLPKGCVVFPNDHGTAPGLRRGAVRQAIIMLPGPPRELIPMFNDYVGPYLSKFAGGTIFSRTVGVFGIAESAVAERLADLMSEANPSVAPYVKDGEVTIRITARGRGHGGGGKAVRPRGGGNPAAAGHQCIRRGCGQPAENGGIPAAGEGTENRHGGILYRGDAVQPADGGARRLLGV